MSGRSLRFDQVCTGKKEKLIMIDNSEVVIVLKLNAKGEAVQVEDAEGNTLKCLNEDDIAKQPIQGTVKALEPIILITTQYNPTCTWIKVGRSYYMKCW
jgi:hypothetical protein